MAKKDAPKTANTAKIPKRIAGVKVPKKLRKSGDALIARANSPIGREVLAAGIAAIATAAAASRAKKAERTIAEPPAQGLSTGGTPSDASVDRIVDAIGNAANTLVSKLFEKKTG